MTKQEALSFVLDVNRFALNMAREEKPSGSWPEWAIEMDMELTVIESDLRKAARKELGCDESFAES